MSTANGVSCFGRTQIWFVNKAACLPSSQHLLSPNVIRSVMGTIAWQTQMKLEHTLQPPLSYSAHFQPPHSAIALTLILPASTSAQGNTISA